MKSTQLLSVVLSLIMFTGVSAGGAAFADSDDYYDELEDVLEDFCELTDAEQTDAISDYSELADYEQRLAEICAIDDIDERYDSLFDIIDEIIPEARDDVDDDFDEIEDEFDDVIEDFEDCVEAGYPIMESYPEQCMTDDGTVFVNDEDDDDRDEYDDDRDEYEDYDKDEDDYDRDYVRDGRHYDLDKRLDYFCEMTDEEKRLFFEDHPRMEQFSDRLANYCDLSEDERENKLRDFVRDHVRDEDRDRNLDRDFRHNLVRYCEMSDEDKRLYIDEHDKPADKVEKMDRFCTLNETDRADFIAEHRDEYRDYMKDRMHDKIKDKHHMNYDRFCSMAALDRAAEVTDVAKLDRINNWCDMTPEERKEYKREHHDSMKDKSNMPFDRMSDVAKDRMSDVAKDRLHDKMKMLDDSHRLKAMIMSKYDISDERMDEIKMKYREKHGDISEEKRTEIKMKFKDHMRSIKIKMSDERKSEIHDRLAEMRDFKAELRDRASDLTDEEKQQLREEFIEKAKDLQLAWISPRTQMTAGVDAAEVECREGFSLVMKASNGVAMCLKADTALKMIDRGIVVPAN